MNPREKELTVRRISYLIYSAFIAYSMSHEVGIVTIELDRGNMSAYLRSTDYLKTVHDLKTKIREQETPRH